MIRLFTAYCVVLSLFSGVINAQQSIYRYHINLKEVVNDQVEVSLLTPSLSKNQAIFHFPSTIPGTYATEDYGRFIAGFEAKDVEGKNLIVQKKGNNSFVIENAQKLHSVSYKVEDSFDAKVKKDKIFEPAGTNIEAEKNFVMNNSGFFGFFEGMENLPFELSFTKPTDLYGATAMTQLEYTPNLQKMYAKNYHELVDSPVLFAAADTVSFRINSTHVLLAVYDEAGRKEMAKEIYGEMKNSMEAIAKFLPTLPVKNYAFLIYIADLSAVGNALNGGGSLVEKVSVLKHLIGKGFGALEHGTSSFYYMPELGMKDYEVKKQMKDVAIHEFMHIITPLGLHSQHIGNFDYVNPIMSKHLWLYEGITEYFAGLIQVQGGLISEDKYFSDLLVSKIKAGEKFPATKMSMTEMSTHVLEKKYKKQYIHVYDRGAVLGFLLDAEIIRLTKGQKTLKEVVLSLRSQYGSNKSFNEESFIQEFVGEVHPDLQQFFNTYIQGRSEWDLKKGFETIGIEYEKNKVVLEPKDPASKKENDIALTGSIIQIGDEKTITKVGKKEWAGLNVKDKIQAGAYQKAFKDAKGNYLPEGETAQYPIIRDGKEALIPVKVSYTHRKHSPYIKNKSEKTPSQQKYYNRWIGNGEE